MSRKLLFALTALLFTGRLAFGQTTITSTGTGNAAIGTTTSCIVFAVQNTNTTGILVTGLGNYMPASTTNTFSLWYHPSNITGIPPDVTTANGWILAATGSPVTSSSTAGITTVLSNMNLTVPAGANYRFALVGTSSPYVATSGTSPVLVSGGGVNLHSQASTVSPSYAGTFPGPVSTTPRGFYGSITFSAVTAVPGCVSAPLAPANNAANVCSGTTVLRWNRVSSATGYDVYLNPGTGTPATVVSANQADTFYNAATTVGAYVWKVVPKNAIGPATGCATFSFTTVQSATVTATITVSPRDSICIGVPATFTAVATNGGTAPAYQWKKNNVNVGLNRATYTDSAVANADSYKVVITSNAAGCLTSPTATSNTIVMRILPPQVVRITAGGPSAFCTGGAVTLSVPSGAVSYQWLNGTTPVAGATASTFVAQYSGLYRVRVLPAGNNACPSLSDSARVTVYTLPVPRVNRNGNVLTTQPNFTTYQWYKGINPIAGATTNTYTIANDGQYSVRVTDSAGCTGTSAGVPVNNLAVNNIAAGSVSIYPNPAVNALFIDAPFRVTVTIRSMEGKTVLYQEDARQLDISAIAAGIYTLAITDSRHQLIRMEKLVKSVQ